MNEADVIFQTAEELVIFARDRGCNLKALCHNGTFCSDRGWVSLQRNDGSIAYSMQGEVGVLPARFRDSASEFRGMYHETGSLETIDQAFEFVKAWLLEGREVDDLPSRSIRSQGIG